VFAYEYGKVDSDYKVECIYFTIENIIKQGNSFVLLTTIHTEYAVLEYEEDRFKMKYVGEDWSIFMNLAIRNKIHI
jgi:hypothetical protein